MQARFLFMTADRGARLRAVQAAGAAAALLALPAAVRAAEADDPPAPLRTALRAPLAACESGGDTGAVGGGGLHRGKYQFDRATWSSVGGSGDPAAASEAEQDMRAALLYERAGAAPWPVCGG